MPVRILVAEELVLARGENRRGDDHNGHGDSRSQGGLMSDLGIVGQNMPRRRRQNESDDVRADSGAGAKNAISDSPSR